MNGLIEPTIGFAIIITMIPIIILFKPDLIAYFGDKYLVIGICFIPVSVGGFLLIHGTRDNKVETYK